MKGDFSRVTFPNAREKHYSGVLSQQGKVQLDADLNEQQAIQRYRMETAAADAVGGCGTPKLVPGFQVTTDGSVLRIGSGRYYVDGILCENEQDVRYDPDPAAVEPNQPDLLDPTAVQTLLAGTNHGLVYLDVWQRHITALDDDYIREKALGGPDTTTRIKTLWQVKVLPIGAAVDVEVLKERLRRRQDLLIPEWTNLTVVSKGTMNARTQQADTSPENDCLLPPQAGYKGLENQLYRVEIHGSGDRTSATFKFSSDNGTIVADIESISGTEVVVTDTGRDEILGFSSGNWVEMVNDADDLGESPQPGQLVQIDQVNPATRVITLKTALPAVGQSELEARHYKLRRWDQTGAAATANGISMSNDWITLENDIQVLFSPGRYVTGDYWLIPARNVLGEIEWPPFEVPNDNPEPSPPHGIEHHYCPLALVELMGGALAVHDCRLLFPPLTNIMAADVYFDDSVCTPELPPAKTVQEAMDALCQRSQGRCQVTVIPVLGWESQLTGLADRDAEICFQNGLYEVATRVIVRNRGNLEITGAGPGTRIVATNDEAALQFMNCRNVTVRDLHAESRKVGLPATGQPQLSGALTFRNCGSVTVENVSLKCASAPERAATCLTVTRSGPLSGISAAEGLIRIQHNDLRVGHLQIGILLVNPTRARVTDNMIRVGKKPKGLNLKRLLQSKQYRAAVRDLMIHSVEFDPPTTTVSGDQVLVEANGQKVRFRTHSGIGNGWDRLMKAIRPRGVQNARDLYWHLRNVADRLLLNEGRYPGVDPSRTRHFVRWYELLRQSMRTVADQGIVVGGTVGRDIQIQQNTIWGVHQGITLGVSHDYAPGEKLDALGSVKVADNEVIVFLSPSARVRHGIFVGNCQQLFVENNNVNVGRFAVTEGLTIDGIRVYGTLGEKMIIRHNSLLDATTGIRVRPLNTLSRKLWLVADNVMPGAALEVPGTVMEQNNIVL